jgi:two-component system, chemotaxis family, chemotaxis protein CheY
MAKILIAEDSVFMRQMVKDILNRAGYQDVIEAENGQQAIDLVGKEKPDLLLLDIIMPEVDGIGVLEKIDTKLTPVIVISAVGQEKMVDKAKALGIAGYIVKPFEEEKVVEAVKNLLGE